MHDMSRVTYRKIIQILNFSLLTLRSVEFCVTIRILTKTMAVVAFHESTWGLQRCLTEFCDTQ